MINQNKNSSDEYLYIKSPQKLNIDAMYAGIENIKTNQELPRDLRILEDATGVDTTIEIEEIEAVLASMYDAALSYTSIKHAVIHDKPSNTAMALLFAYYIQSSNYELQVFSTEEAAKQWLLSKV